MTNQDSRISFGTPESRLSPDERLAKVHDDFLQVVNENLHVVGERSNAQLIAIMRSLDEGHMNVRKMAREDVLIDDNQLCINTQILCAQVMEIVEERMKELSPESGEYEELREAATIAKRFQGQFPKPTPTLEE